MKLCTELDEKDNNRLVDCRIANITEKERLGRVLTEEEFELYKVETWNGLTDDQMDQLFKKTVRKSIVEKKAKGLPVARYDENLRETYLEMADGSREYYKDITKHEETK